MVVIIVKLTCRVGRKIEGSAWILERDFLS